MNIRFLTGFVLLAFSLFSGGLVGQTSGKSKIIFAKKNNNFGKIKEEAGPVSTTFSFVNSGNAPLELIEVKATCGCTTPSWSEGEIAPGDSGWVKTSFDPKGRPGLFEKFVTVRTNGSPASVVLVLRGEVLPRQKGPKELYPFDEGGLRLKTNHIAFGKLKETVIDTGRTTLYNESTKPIQLDFAGAEVPAHLELLFETNEIAPGKTLEISVVYNASKKKDYGFLFESMFIKSNDPEKGMLRLNVSADIEEDFSKLTSTERANAPKVYFAKSIHDFGKVAEGEKVSTTFSIKNTGKSDLLIRKTKASCGCTATQPEKSLLAPGETTNINVTFNTTGKSGPQEKFITVICNDPKSPAHRLRIKANVVSKKG